MARFLDKLSGLMKNNEESSSPTGVTTTATPTSTEAPGGGGYNIENLKVIVSSEHNADPDQATYSITLCERAKGDSLNSVKRSWSQCEKMSSFLRSTFPKLDIPSHKAKGVAALVIEDRRKHITASLNAAMGHRVASQTKEVKECCGFPELLLSQRNMEINSIGSSSHHQGGGIAGGGLDMTARRVTAAERLAVRQQQREQQAHPDGVFDRPPLRHRDTTTAPSRRSDPSVSNASFSDASSISRLKQRSSVNAPNRSSINNNTSSSINSTGGGGVSSSGSPPSARSSRSGGASGASDRPSSALSVSIDTTTDEERAKLEQCFKLIDVDLTGVITRDEMEVDFFPSLPGKLATSRQLDAAIAAGDKDKNGTFDRRAFFAVVSHLSSQLGDNVTILKIVECFVNRKLTSVYEYIGGHDIHHTGEGGLDTKDSVGGEGQASSSTPPVGKYQHGELKALLYVISISGMRMLNASEVEKAGADQLSLSMTLPEFHEALQLLTAIVPADELIKALKPNRRRRAASKDGGQHKVISLINKYVLKASSSKVRRLQAKVEEIGGVKAGAQCPQCDVMNKELEQLKAEMSLLRQRCEVAEKKVDQVSKDYAEKKEQVEALSDASLNKNTNVSELHSKIEELEEQLKNADEVEAELMERLYDLEAELDIEREKVSSSGGSDDETSNRDDDGDGGGFNNEFGSKVNTYFLTPSHLGSNERSQVVDLPGALVYELPVDFEPLGLAFDLFLTGEGSKGCEYIAARDKNGLRILALTIDGDQIICPGAADLHMNPLRLPTRKWVRAVLKFYWTSKVFDLLLDDEKVLSGIPMRDAESCDSSIATLDVYPRQDVLVCYANMFFFR